jgi:hypothetical protein
MVVATHLVIGVAVLAGVLFIGGYGYRANWRTTPIGWATMLARLGSLACVIALYITLFRPLEHATWFRVYEVLATGTFAAAMLWNFVLMLDKQRSPQLPDGVQFQKRDRSRLPVHDQPVCCRGWIESGICPSSGLRSMTESVCQLFSGAGKPL